MILDFLLIFSLGFLGSFGHCTVMCGPLTVAFSLSQKSQKTSNWQSSLIFHFLLNLGRILSYALVGGTLGGLGSILIASGQLAGIGSNLRQGIVIVTGLMLIWFGLAQINPDLLPRLPILHPLHGKLHDRLNSAMGKVSMKNHWWMPALLGIFWGLIPCGFLYAAQIKAAESGDLLRGAAIMLSFGLGTMPIMVGVGVSASRLSSNRRSQLFKLGGWITLTIGFLTLFRGDGIIDYMGHGSLFLLILALIARPISGLWSTPLEYRRIIGLGAYILAVAHTGHVLAHSLNWNLEVVAFMLPIHKMGFFTGVVALLLMSPAAFTSTDGLQKVLGKSWRRIHLLSVPAFILAVIHAIGIGSTYLGELNGGRENLVKAIAIACMALVVLVLRSNWVCSILTPKNEV